MERLIDELEMSLERQDDIVKVQNIMREIALKLKKNKNKNIEKKFNNLIRYFQQIYLFN